jgi:hypothetical protein
MQVTAQNVISQIKQCKRRFVYFHGTMAWISATDKLGTTPGHATSIIVDRNLKQVW